MNKNSLLFKLVSLRAKRSNLIVERLLRHFVPRNDTFKERAQSTLEVALTIIAVILLVGGMVKIWFWSNNQIVERQLRYNATRVAAGSASDTYKLQWPVYAPSDLEEKDVILDKSK